jgi:exopolysaccharide biosynthesis WecB/TagA/CpsF family protein
MQDLSGGGVERMRLTLAATLQARGLDVSLVVGTRQGPLMALLPQNMPVLELGTARTWQAIPRLARFLRDSQPDIIISSLDHNNIAAMIARVLSGSAARLIVCQHNALSAERVLGWKYRLVPLAYRMLHRSANAVVAVSRGVANDLAVSGIPRAKISVIYNPVVDGDFAAKCAGPPPYPWLANKIGPVFVSVGRLTAQKDPYTLLAALRILLDKAKARLILVGEGEAEPALRRYAIKRGIAHAVAFVGYQINPLPWIMHADALISSSRYEGFGNAIVEALACGTQVIATDCPHGPSEVLLEGALGTLVPVGDVEALAEAMAHVTTKTVDAAKLRARAAAFTASACADAHLNLFRRIVVGRSQIVHALGMDLSPLSPEQVVNRLVEMPGPDCVRLMVTPNLDHVRLLRRPDFAAAYADAHLVCPDGLPVLLYARMRGLKLRTRVTGCEVVALLLRHAGLRQHRLFLVVESAATERAAHAWAQCVGMTDRVTIAVAPPSLGTDDQAQDALVRRIRKAWPTILMMTLGAPVSEVFVHRHRHSLPNCWGLCVGQALRVELRLAQRAPVAWRKAGLEWLWRLRREPRRLAGRYARALAWFPVAVWRDLAGREPAEGG